MLLCDISLARHIKNVNEQMKNYNNTPIKNWSVEDRPREKLLQYGIQSLSNAELIGIILGSGTREMNAVELARQLLASVDNNMQELGRMSIDMMKETKGIGSARAIILKAALELGSRQKATVIDERVAITGSRVAYEMLAPLVGKLEHEEFWILILNRANKVIKSEKISQGGLTGTVIDTRIILKHAIEKRATSLIICHNHPSGNRKPSEADISITRKIKEAAKIMDIKLIDHIIVTENSYFSFADEGYL